MKLYKFRSLGDETDFDRLKDIIVKKKFWCSKIWDLNDPMEGVYKNSFFNREQIEKTFTEKNEYRICSFSGEKGLDDSRLWGYYANGFKGVAIEIEVEKNDVCEIRYVTPKNFRIKQVNAKKIITRKLTKWKHEDEYRFLIKSEEKEHEIGEITKIYFGNPYGDLNNTFHILKESNLIKKYRLFKEKIIATCKNNGIKPEIFSI